MSAHYTQLIRSFVKLLCLLCFGGAFFFGFVAIADAATLSLSPGTGVYTAGGTFTARVAINTEGQSINAAEGSLTFNPKELTVVGISKGTIFNLWTAEPSFSNSAGTITFGGGSPAGYTGGAGTIINVTFRAQSAGKPKVSFVNGSVLAADGRGTNVLTTMNGGTYTITAADFNPEPETIEYVAPANTPPAPKITSTTHPDSNAWYKEKNALLTWSVPAGVTAVRTLLDTQSGSIPTKVYDDPIDQITLDNLDEGVNYFHIQLRNADGWGRVTHYRLAIDSVKPASFTISLPEGADLSNPIQTLVLTTKDETSAVRRFLIQIDGADPYEYIDETASGTVKLPSLEPGHHSVIIEAFDQAGNSLISTFSFAVLAFDKPQFTEYPTEINEEVIPVIKGITRPNATVRIWLRQQGVSHSSDSADREFEVMSSESGEFIFIPDGRLSLGVYELTAVAIDQYGAQSDVSDPIRIAVQQPGYLRIGSLVVSILSIIVPLFALVIALVIGLVFFIRKIRVFKVGVTREAKEALAILASEFDTLTEVLKSQRMLLAKSRKTNKLTKAEEELVSTIESALKKSNERVRKEIADVEDIVE